LHVPESNPDDSKNLIGELAGEHIDREPIVNDELASKIVEKLDTEGEGEEVDSGDSVAPPESATVPSSPSPNGPKDSEGTVFDPRIHYLDENGKPKKTPTGKFRKRRKGTAPDTVLSEGSEPSPVPIDPKASAELLVNVAESVAVSTLGPKWKAEPGERSAILASLETYFQTEGAPSVPPSWMVLITVGMYALPRVLDTFKSQEMAPDAHSDSGYDGKREIHSGENARADSPDKRENGGGSRPFIGSLGR
jgi:hypothetical protein